MVIGRRAVLTVHDLSPIRHPTVHTRRNVLWHRALLRVTLWRVGTIVVPSKAVERDLANYMPSVGHKVRVIHEGPRVTDPKVASVVSPAGDAVPYVLYVGTIEPRKNVSRLIEAFCGVAPPEWHLVIAGKLGWLSDEEREWFCRLCTNERVRYLGYVSDVEVHELYRSADLFCYVSETEGFGLPIIEAMKYGVPVIHSDDGALIEVAGGAGTVVRRAKLDDDLRSVLRRLMSPDGAERESLRDASRRRARHFSWDRAAQETAEVVHGLIGT
jgi:glycosyltransferase involved in cell wall biosynthesis